MDLQLKNKRVLVTGSTAGIGYSIAATLASEGAQVIINGRSQAAVTQAMTALSTSTGNPVKGFAGDLSQPAATAQLLATFPAVDILINNLGIFEPKPFAEISDDDWLHFFNVNVLSGVRLSRLYLPAMQQANWGRIIFISSESGIQIPPEMIHYGVTKTAQIAVARGLAESLAGSGITVNSILPGPTQSRGVGDFVTQMAQAEGKSAAQFESDFFKTVRPSSLIQRFATPQEVANLVAYVASPLSSATTGAALRVDGGVIKSAF